MRDRRAFLTFVGMQVAAWSVPASAGRAFDLTLPDSHAVRDAYAQAEAESPPWLFNHVVRSWLYGAKLTQRRALTPDAELVAVAVLARPRTERRGRDPCLDSLRESGRR